MDFLILLLAALVSVTGRSVPRKQPTCGYESCHPVKDGFVNIHIVPHTHDDVGWLKTVEQYYYGSRPDIQKAGVQYIIDSVVESLRKNADRRFIYVETFYFWKWWLNQDEQVRQEVKGFVNSGRLEFIGGGWSMNDEAATHYHSTIDNFAWGLRKLNETFGDCGRPKIGWQIDPFGHSREMASMFAQFGFDGLFLGRIDYQDKAARFSTKTPEIVWKASNSLGDAADIFTGVMYNTYSPPSGFCFDILCNDEPIIDDISSPDYNVDRRVREFLKYVAEAAEKYSTNNVILTMGGDFHYHGADAWFQNLDKLINYTNQRQGSNSKYHALYSTPSCYLKAVHDAAESIGQKWQTKSDDYFPYASDPHAYWTGYFTSRPTIKRFERIGNNYLQICKQLHSLANLGSENEADLDSLRETMGIMQHHDAVTGTEKQHVADDYSRMLTQSIKDCDKITSKALNKIINGPSKSIKGMKFTTCPLTNISSCAITEKSDNFVVTVYNPLSRSVKYIAKLPVSGTAYEVTDYQGQPVTTDLFPIIPAILNIEGRNSDAKYELVFACENLPPLGFKSYYIKRIHGDNSLKPAVTTYKDDNLMQISMNNIDLNITHEFLYYEGYVGNNEVFANRSSGAYIFRPYNNDPTNPSENVTATEYRGKILTETHYKYNSWISEVVRAQTKSSLNNYYELNWIVGPLPLNGQRGREVISRFSTNLDTKSTFYTDSNGREMLKRIKDWRPYPSVLQEPVAANYYPVTSKIVLKDESNDIEFAVLNDRAQGGTSLRDGQLELMVHRNCFHDDAFGVGEALNETAFGVGLVATGSHYLIFGKRSRAEGDSITASERFLAQEKLLAAWTFFSPTNGFSEEEYRDKFVMKYSGLQRSLPKNVQILTLEPWIGNSFLLRLEHILEKDEDPEWSKPVNVDLQGLFTAFKINSIKETTLGGNQWKEDNSRLHFETVDESSRKHTRYVTIEVDQEQLIKLNPMQIRTFVIEVEPK